MLRRTAIYELCSKTDKFSVILSRFPLYSNKTSILIFLKILRPINENQKMSSAVALSMLHCIVITNVLHKVSPRHPLLTTMLKCGLVGLGGKAPQLFTHVKNSKGQRNRTKK